MGYYGGTWTSPIRSIGRMKRSKDKTSQYSNNSGTQANDTDGGGHENASSSIIGLEEVDATSGLRGIRLSFLQDLFELALGSDAIAISHSTPHAHGSSII